MGRQEAPLDPGRGPVQRFAFELRKLRREAGGITYRTMARGTGYSVSTLSRAAAGEQLPSLPVLLAYVAACGGDGADWERRLRTAEEEAAEAAADGDDSDAPYQGLARFEPADSERFFGRDRLVAEALGLVRRCRLSAVFGPSGSGKSSLLRAGLIPALRTGSEARPAALRILTPGPRPARTHAGLFEAKDAPGDTVVVIDQFEEVFTLCADPAERQAFIDLVLTALRPGARLRVVLAVRADFYGRCAEHHALARALTTAGLLVGPMDPAELREAIVKPATADGLIVEQALTARIVREVTGEPGGLPLMSHALLETWRRRKGRALTAAAYDASGGLHGAVARTAENVLAELTSAQAESARRVLLRLITPGDGTQDTRRPVPRAELGDDGTVVLERLVRARLLTLDQDTVDLAHEALITGWPRLRAWVDADRERLRAHRRLTEAATAWTGLGQDPGALYRGTRLAAAEEAFAGDGRRAELTPTEAEFLTESLAARDREQHLAARTTRRLRSLVAGLTALLLVACAAAGVALEQRATARSERTAAVSRQITAEAERLRGTDAPSQTEDVSLAAQLDIASYRMRRSTQTYTSLVSAANATLFAELSDQSRSLGMGGYATNNGRVSYDAHRGRLVLAGDDGLVRLWDTTRFTQPKRIGRALRGQQAALSPDGKVLALEDDTSMVRLWNIARPDRPVRLGALQLPGDENTGTLAFGPDGHLLAAGTRKTSLWDVRDTAHPRLLVRELPGEIPAFSPHRAVLATADGDSGTVRLWNIARPSHPVRLGVLHPETDQGTMLVFSPDGRYLVTNGGVPGQVEVWDTRNPARPTPGYSLNSPDDTSVAAVAYSPDGRLLAVAGENAIQLWNLVTTDQPQRLGGPLGQRTGNGIALAFAPDGRSLIADGETLRIWSLPPTVLLGCGTVATASFAPDGRTAATACPDEQRVRLWDATDPGDVSSLGTLPGTIAVFAPYGHLLAVVAPDGGVRLWDLTHPARPRRLGHLPVTASEHTVYALSFGPDAHTVVTYDALGARGGYIKAKTDGGSDGIWGAVPEDDGVHIRSWDIADPARPVRVGGNAVLGKNAGVTVAAISSDGRLLAVVEGDGNIGLWDTSDPARPVRRGRELPGDEAVFDSRGRTLVIGDEDGTVRLLDTAHPARPHWLGPALDADGSVAGVAMSLDGRRLAVGTEDGLVKLWDTTDPARPTALGDPLVGHTASVSTLAFAPDGGTLATGAQDGSVRLWTLDADRAVGHICAVTGHALSTAQWRRYVGNLPYRPPCP
ncbi:helix-turn-helix domain-containing protein [Streptomyces sp. NPDC088350]|uniref:nSTAND1 domain-containing NTPase n=1 Tax=Streptomyces sp. NPDC088350 TaxID=3365854 RepID=UPI003816E947